MSAVPISEYTDTTVGGAGAFDVLMAAVTAHLDEQYNKSRIRGPEYAQVYLGLVQAAMQSALQFIFGNEKAEQEVALLTQQVLTEIQNTAVALATKCKLDAEFDVLILTKDKVVAETALLNQKKATELGQVSPTGVDADSIIGKQKTLYGRQADGFLRDAEQKVAKIMLDTWNVRRTTDSGTVADATNKLSDTYIGQTVTTLLAGISA